MAKLPKRRHVGAIDGAGRGTVITQPMPQPRPGQVLVKVHASLISPGTELNRARKLRATGENDNQILPFGYQNAGVVVALGTGVKRFAPGQRVACMGGGYAEHADFCVVPQNLCYALPDQVSFEEGAYTHLAITALHALRRGQVGLGSRVLIVGLGLVGQLSAQLAHLAGARVTGWDMQPGRLRVAKACGMDHGVNPAKQDVIALSKKLTENEGYDTAILAIGGDASALLEQVHQVMSQTRDGHAWGRVVVVGGCTIKFIGGAGLGNLDLCASARTGAGYHDEQWEHSGEDYPPVFMRWTTSTNFKLALELMAQRRLRVKPLTTHRLPLARIDEAVAAHLEQPNRTLGTLLRME